MKKILFCSLIMCGFMANSFAAAPVIKKCSETTCQEYKVGGTIEQDLCYRSKTSGATIATDEEELDSWFVKRIGTECTKPGAKRAVCIKNTNNGRQLRSCAARQCDEDHILWLTNTRGGAQSQGACKNIQKLQDWCAEGCGCKEDETCVLKEYTGSYSDGEGSHTAPAYTRAFLGEEACHCVASRQDLLQNQETDCYFEFSVDVQCPNNKSFVRKGTYKLTKEELTQIGLSKCPEQKTIAESMTISGVLKNSIAEYEMLEKVIEKVCKTNSTADLSNLYAATSYINSFIETTDKNADQWKKSDGSFNTARLASDLTAGVVLGTVGGVVSGVVIKKKQVEKGFEALHCAVGGQTVAGWGDEFSVGLRR